MPQCDIILFELAIERTSPLDLPIALADNFELGIEQLRPVELDVETLKPFTMVEM